MSWPCGPKGSLFEKNETVMGFGPWLRLHWPSASLQVCFMARSQVFHGTSKVCR